MAQALLYVDDRALAAWLGGAAAAVPGLADALVDQVALEETGDPLGRALVFQDDALPLPAPGEEALGTRLGRATLDRDGKLLTLEPPSGRRARERRKVAGQPAAAAAPLGRVLRPATWTHPPDDASALFLVREAGPTLAALVTEHLELGRSDVRFARVTAPGGKGKGKPESWVALDVGPPAWFVLERWLGRAEHARGDVLIYRRVVGPLGPRRILIAWGLAHPLEGWLQEPKDERDLLLIDADGAQRLLRQDALEDVTGLLDLDPSRFAATRLELAGEPPRIAVALRLEGRGRPRDPELWLLPEAQRERLERLLACTPEDELRNLLVACVGRPGGERLFAVREALTGRAPRLLPLGERAFAPMPGLPSLLVPCDRTVAPPLGADRYARAFGLRPGELTVVDELPPAPGAGEAGLELLRIEERLFRPVDSIVDFVVDADAQRLTEVVLAAPFDLGTFAEEDLAPTAPAGRARREVERDDAEPRTAEAAPEAAPAKVKAKARDKTSASARPRESRATRVAEAPDPRREAIAALERELALEKPTPAAWRRLSALLFEDAQPEEALRAFEHAAWELRGEPCWAALAELEAPLRAAARPGPFDPGVVLLSALQFRREASAMTGPGRADAYRRAADQVYGLLREQGQRLRKRTRWLAWQLVVTETRDAIEAERQREDILAELALRGVAEDEVAPFVRRLLLEHFGLREASGPGAADATTFLERARAFAAALRHSAIRAEALSHVAWALVELGEGARGLAVAAEAEKAADAREGAPPHEAYRARARARLGACHERVGGPGQGRARIERALSDVAGLLKLDGDQHKQEVADAQKALVSIIGSLADARGPGGGRADDPLVARVFEVIGERPAVRQAMVLCAAATDLMRLGAGARALTLARALLAKGQLTLIYTQDAAAALEVLLGDQPPSEDDARRLLQSIVDAPDVDEHSLGMLKLALRAGRRPPWEVVDETRRKLRERPYAAALVTLAGLQRMAELRERERGPRLLAEAIDEAWALGSARQQASTTVDARKVATRETTGASVSPQERMRLVVRLAALVPAFGLRERGLELLGQIQQRAGQERDVYIRNELMMAAASAAAKLGDTRASFDLVEQLATKAIEAYQATEPRSAGPSWLLFGTLEICADAAAELGDTRRGPELVARIAAAARAALGRRQQGALEIGRFFFLKTLIRCGHAALALGDADAADAAWGEAFGKIKETQNHDLTELLERAAETAGQLEGVKRYALARRVVDTAEQAGASGDLFERFAIELTNRLARDMVRGESAFAAALKRWKGREERSIRDRVAVE